jgi:hypothetical protein
MVIFGVVIFVTVFVFVVVKELMSYGKPYSKSLNTETAVEEKVVPKKQQKKKAKKRKESDSAIINAARTSNLYNMASGYGAAGVSSDDDDFDEAEYRAYREELAAYDDFVASLDMDD